MYRTAFGIRHKTFLPDTVCLNFNYCLAEKVSQQVSLQQFAVQLPILIIPALQESSSV